MWIVIFLKKKKRMNLKKNDANFYISIEKRINLKKICEFLYFSRKAHEPEVNGADFHISKKKITHESVENDAEFYICKFMRIFSYF